MSKMITLKILGIENNKFLMIDENHGKLYNLFFEFYGMETLKIDDKITFDERLLNRNWEGYTQPYAFEIVKKMDEYDQNKKEDFAIIKVGEKEVVARRIYG